MISITQYNLDKIEALLEELGYKVRYEKGNFKTGACVIQHTKVIVVNKFSNLEIKINSLVQLLREFELTKGDLEEKQWAFYKSLTKEDN
jgi:ABC-type transport system substrate-binding protein